MIVARDLSGTVMTGMRLIALAEAIAGPSVDQKEATGTVTMITGRAGESRRRPGNGW